MNREFASARRALAAATILLVGIGRVAPAQAVCTPGACALSLGSSSAYVTFGNTAALGLANVTIETWFNRQGTGVPTGTGTGGIAAFVPLVTKGAAQGDGSNVDANYVLGINTAGNVIAADFEEGAAGANPGLNHPISGVTPISNGTWYHAAATYDGTTWRLYLNGGLEAQSTVGQPMRSDSIQHAGLGTAMTSTGAAAGFFNGILDEVRIWSVARSQADIQSTINTEVPTATNLVARWGLNEGSGTVVGDSAGVAQNGTVTGTGFNWVAGSPFDANLPPAQPTLNAPSDGATGVPTSPTLDVDVSDPDGGTLTVNFYGRPVAPAAADFTLVALPDTQYYSAQINGGQPAMFNAQTQWIVDNRVSRNIAFVPHLGDCTENGNVTVEWQRADTAMQIVENPLTTGLTDGVPYSITVGNHDQAPSGDPNGTATYNLWFGESRFLGRGYYGGHYGADNDNHYELFSAGGMDFIVINLEYDTTPDQPVLDWADALLKAYPNRRGIVVSHWIIGTGNPGSFGTQGQAIYDNLKDNPNLDFMLAGHVPGEGRRQDTFGGNTTYTFMSDYQARTGGGNGWLRIMTFSPASNTVHVETYSPWLNQSETDADSDFTVSYDMGGAGFVLLGSTNVPSGSSATLPWPNLDPGQQYEWYVTVSDGATTTTGPVWSFTTTAGGCGDGVLQGGEQCDDGDALGGDGCSATCQLEGCWSCAGQPSVCTPANGAPCDDGLFCNGLDTCSGGACANHAGDPCTGGAECADSCNETADNCFDAPGTPCANDGQVCTTDACNGAGVCAHPAGNAGTLCRAGSGDSCDPNELCNGSSTTCPANVVTPAGTVCNPGSGDVCDPDETCTGIATQPCPADVVSGALVTCRPSTGACDVADHCTGIPNQPCPSDAVAPSSTTCRPIAGLCDVAEHCDGTNAACPADAVQPTTTTCRPATDFCDVAEKCDGTNAACPADAVKPSTTTCRPIAGLCDVAEHCDGTTVACPADAVAPSSTTCRPIAGPCDVAEQCDGTTATCPTDAVAPDTVTCRPSLGVCDLPEGCDGGTVDCPSDGKSTAECRASTDVCDAAESCSGTSDDCPPDAFEPSSTVCRPSTSTCDLDENCTGSGASCPADTGLPDTDGDTVCDALDNCDAIVNPTQSNADVDAFGDACDPCTNLVPTGQEKTKLTLTKLLAPADDDKLTFKGYLTNVPDSPPIDPVTKGLRMLITDSTGLTPIDITIPGGGYDAVARVGWRVNGSGTAWTFKNPDDGIQKVQLKSVPSAPRKYKFSVKGKNGSYAVNTANLPLVGTVVIDAPYASTGQCGEATFPATPPARPSCTSAGEGNTVKCR